VDVGLDQILADQQLPGQELLVRDAFEVVAERDQRAAHPLRVVGRGADEDVHVESRPRVAVDGEGRRADHDVVDAMVV
jgi:hypothetical protein